MTKDLSGFQNQVVLVTGAAQGIGRAAAKLVHERGGRVIALDISQEGLQSVRSELDLDASSVYQVDIGNEPSVRNAISKIYEENGGIHALINCAGIVGPSNVDFEKIVWNEFEATLRINLFGAIWLTQAVIPYMKQNKYGRIVHVASIAGKEGNPGMAPYNVSKSGMIGFVKGAAKEAASYGITINAVAPAVIRTPMNTNTSEETLKYMISKIPMGRVGEADEVAHLLAFIASRACSYTTGFTFDASGGRATY